MRKPGQSRSASQVIARATLGAAGVVVVIVGVAALGFPGVRASILAGGAIAVGLNLVTLAAMEIAERYFADMLGAAMVGAYVFKMAAFAVAALALKNSGLNLRVVIGVFVFSLVVSLAIYSVVTLKGKGPFVGEN